MPPTLGQAGRRGPGGWGCEHPSVPWAASTNRRPASGALLARSPVSTRAPRPTMGSRPDEPTVGRSYPGPERHPLQPADVGARPTLTAPGRVHWPLLGQRTPPFTRTRRAAHRRCQVKEPPSRRGESDRLRLLPCVRDRGTLSVPVPSQSVPTAGGTVAPAYRGACRGMKTRRVRPQTCSLPPGSARQAGVPERKPTNTPLGEGHPGVALDNSPGAPSGRLGCWPLLASLLEHVPGAPHACRYQSTEVHRALHGPLPL